jgi:hypothetical protein
MTRMRRAEIFLRRPGSERIGAGMFFYLELRESGIGRSCPRNTRNTRKKYGRKKQDGENREIRRSE